MNKIYAISNFNGLTIVLFGIAILSFVGCGDSSIAPVSGKVTVDGKPVEGIRLVFSPMPTGDETDPGPWSSGLTNAAGEYSLATRYKDNGAVVGQHTVAFVYDGADKISIYRELLREAKADGDKAGVDAAKKQIADHNALQASRPKAAGEYTEKFEVPLGGTAEANFQLPE